MGEVLNFSTFQPSKSPVEDTTDYLNTLFDKCSGGYVEIRQKSGWGILTLNWISLVNPKMPDFPDDEHIYIGVATRKNQSGGTKNDIKEIPALWTDVDFKDIDQAEIDQRIDDFPLRPSMIVKTGNGYHLYWILDTPATTTDIQRIEEINKRLVSHFGGDAKATDAARVLRLPGTYNIKYDPHRLVTIESKNNKTYSINDFEFLQTPPSEPQSGLSIQPEKQPIELLQGVSEGNRHGSLISLAGLFKRSGLTADDTKLILAKWNRNNQPPEDEHELIHQIDDIYKRYSATIGEDKCQLIEDSAMSLTDILGMDLKEEPLIIDPWLRRGELGMITAERGIGKTWLILSMFMVATGQMTLGKWTCGEPTDCLLIDGEMSLITLQSRARELVKSKQDTPKAPFRIVSAIQMRNEKKSSLLLTNPEWRKGILDFLSKHRNFKLVGFDNIASLAPNLDENIKKDWDPINQFFLDLKSLGVSVIMVHHANKHGLQRGTSAREDNLDFSIKLTKPKDHSPEDGASFKLEFVKNRNLFGIAAKPFNLTLTNDSTKGLRWEESEAVAEAAESSIIRDQVIEQLKHGFKQTLVADSLNIPKARVNQIKAQAVKEGRLKEEEVVKGKPGRQPKISKELSSQDKPQITKHKVVRGIQEKRTEKSEDCRTQDERIFMDDDCLVGLKDEDLTNS